MSYNPCNCGNDRRQLLTEISKVDFTLKELNLYLDTHPFDQQAIREFNNYNNIKRQLTEEYTVKFGPIVLNIMDENCNEWKWALQDWPWERGYN